MNDILYEIQEYICFISLNRIDKHNAFDSVILADLQELLTRAQQDPKVTIIVLKAHGKHFSVGADLLWMQQMAQCSMKENIADARILARLMYDLHYSEKPTIAMVHGLAIGGGAGLVAACDIAIAATDAKFCFAEVKLGLIPAVISPYVIKAIGERAANSLFISAETFDTARALALGLIQHSVPAESLLDYTYNYARQITCWPTRAVCAAKALVKQISPLPIDVAIQDLSASLIATQRASAEAQNSIQKFFNKEANV